MILSGVLVEGLRLLIASFPITEQAIVDPVGQLLAERTLSHRFMELADTFGKTTHEGLLGD